MGSTSDWETMKNASDILTEFDVAEQLKTEYFALKKE